MLLTVHEILPEIDDGIVFSTFQPYDRYTVDWTGTSIICCWKLASDVRCLLLNM